MIELRSGGSTDVGRVRAKNQDSWKTTEALFAVADGMGGHKGGEVASQLAVDVLVDRTDEPSAAALISAAHAANDAIFAEADARPELRGMGTTLCALALVDADDDEELAVVNVGDSRCYRLRDGELDQITRDHSLVEDMRASGQITAEEAAVHPHRNIVTRALGIAPVVDIDEFAVIPATGDRYLLCSDGLFNEVAAEVIVATLERIDDPEAAAIELVRLANDGGGRDNITCVIVDVLDDGGRAERAAAAGVESIRSRLKTTGDAERAERERDGDTGVVPVTELPAASGAAANDASATAKAKAKGASNDSVSDDPEPPGDASLDDTGARRTRDVKRSAKRDDQREASNTRATGAGHPEPKRAESKRSRRRRNREPRLRRATWRTAVFALMFLAILAAAAGAVGWYARGTYFVGIGDQDQVMIYKGRPNRVLWFDATIARHTGIAKAQIPEVHLDAIAKGKELGSLDDAEAYLDQVRTLICSNLRNGAEPPEPAASAPSTTIPDACAADIERQRRAATTTSTTASSAPTTTQATPPTTTPAAPPAP